MNRDDRVENPTAEFALAHPGVIRPNGLTQRTQCESEQRKIAGDTAVEAHGPPRIGRDPEQSPLAIGLEHTRAGVIKRSDHAALSYTTRCSRGPRNSGQRWINRAISPNNLSLG